MLDGADKERIQMRKESKNVNVMILTEVFTNEDFNVLLCLLDLDMVGLGVGNFGGESSI